MLVHKIAENYKLPYYTISLTYSVCMNHGYIAGEHFKCPECGEATEVYSRITGYYCPVQNWNDGKTQEYKDRRLYNTGVPARNSNDEEQGSDEILLFTTARCPNCQTAVSFLDKEKVVYSKIIAEENPGLVEKFNVNQAPTLIAVKNGMVEKIVNVPNIKKYVESLIVII